MAQRAIRGRRLPNDHYGVDLSKIPDTYVPAEPIVAYRAWNWTSEGITSLNRAMWTPKKAFEAKCPLHEALRSMQASSCSEAAKKFWQKQAHLVIIPIRVEEAKRRLDKLAEFEVEIYLQFEEEAKVGQETLPLWMPDYGYSTQGLSWLVEHGRKWYAKHPKRIQTLKVGDRVAVFSTLASGIGIVKEIDGSGIMHYTMFSKDKIFCKPAKDVKWSDRNWRWETSGLGSVRKLGCWDYHVAVT